MGAMTQLRIPARPAVSIERKLIKKITRLFVAISCVGGIATLSACVGPDLEPPDTRAASTLPGTPNAPGATAGKAAADGDTPLGAAAATNPTTGVTANRALDAGAVIGPAAMNAASAAGSVATVPPAQGAPGQGGVPGAGAAPTEAAADTSTEAAAGQQADDGADAGVPDPAMEMMP